MCVVLWKNIIINDIRIIIIWYNADFLLSRYIHVYDIIKYLGCVLALHCSFCSWAIWRSQFPIKTISWEPWISQVQRNGLPSIILSAQPCILRMIFFTLKLLPAPTANTLRRCLNILMDFSYKAIKKVELNLSCFYYKDACIHIDHS